MDIILGLGASSVTALMFCWAFGAHRRPVPARWTRTPGLSMLICVSFTMLTPLSLGLFVRAALDPARVLATFDWQAALIASALVVVAAVLCPLLIRAARQGAPAVAQNRNAAPAAAQIGLAA